MMHPSVAGHRPGGVIIEHEKIGQKIRHEADSYYFSSSLRLLCGAVHNRDAVPTIT